MGFDPASLALVSMGAGSILGAGSSIMGGNAEAASAQYQAGVAQKNAEIAGQNRVLAQQQGNEREADTITQGRALIGTQTAGQAASGLDVNSGSAVDVRSSTAALNQEGVRREQQKTAADVQGYRIQEYDLDQEAKAQRAAAASARTSGTLGAVTSLLGGAASIGGQFVKYQQSGVPMPWLGLNEPIDAPDPTAYGYKRRSY